MLNFGYKDLPAIIEGLRSCKKYIRGVGKGTHAINRGLCSAIDTANEMGELSWETKQHLKGIVRRSFKCNVWFLFDQIMELNPTANRADIWDNEIEYRKQWINRMIRDYRKMYSDWEKENV